MRERVVDRPDSRDTYSSRLRTALVFVGTGTAGAYHAGALRALHEAGVRIDLVSGRGVGLVSAMFAAIDGGARLWEAGGLWRSRAARHFYAWSPAWRVAGWLLAVALAGLLMPVGAILVGLLIYPAGFFMRLMNLEAGSRLVGAYVAWLGAAFEPAGLPTIVPRTVSVALAGSLIALLAARLAGFSRARGRQRRPRRTWSLVGAPLGARRIVDHFEEGLWQLIRGATPIKRPRRRELSRRYCELLLENLGQPGFRELLATAYDLDAGGDMIFALLAEPYRPGLTRPAAARRGGGALIDLTGVGRDHALDALAAALSLPVATEPHPMAFAAESYWRGETHRTHDRPAAVARLMEAVADAGVEQVIIMAAVAETGGPHRLSSRPGGLKGRVGEFLAASDRAALDDGSAAWTSRFKGVFQIRPAHNPLGPFDFAGCHDERSDRWQSLTELIDRGYEDAYRQFIEPVIGASGERLESTARELS